MAITKAQVLEAQKEWGRGIVEIGAAFTNGADYSARATQHIRELYAYGTHEVLFKPTKCEHRQFRPTFEGALSYFVSGNHDFPEDEGFALAPYIAVEFINANMTMSSDMALAMGNYYFTDTSGKITKVEYTFAYRESKPGLKIVAHHSSLPYHHTPPHST
ncbi:phosphoribosyl-AMP cyclohydrolase [Pseudenhygromyxa sp. WMMC2535]|uniref:phosphoribosyl-AMP cyclohydrolase n=1 Tax=Pseudenhygromyxa sp. WMMC2535 TaxID=2712867 RepID=UPI001551AD1F|nr:phosphoribosyl-AMP cyclohydrolase [Pseudenhygromyxa sp. WMMC2535]NVB39877.1 phosphoribosyl-AMP cyclohydrolase [Pseudenhygromyxa sp. WMMC2535]